MRSETERPNVQRRGNSAPRASLDLHRLCRLSRESMPPDAACPAPCRTLLPQGTKAGYRIDLERPVMLSQVRAPTPPLSLAHVRGDQSTHARRGCTRQISTPGRVPDEPGGVRIPSSGQDSPRKAEVSLPGRLQIRALYYYCRSAPVSLAAHSHRWSPSLQTLVDFRVEGPLGFYLPEGRMPRVDQDVALGRNDRTRHPKS